MKYN
jgi:hypothetical protein